MRESSFCAHEPEEPVRTAAEGWGGTTHSDWRNDSEPYEDEQHIWLLLEYL